MTSQAATRPEDDYIARVLDHIPFARQLRSQIDMDLRSHIAERMEHGQSIDDVVQQLGDPATLAESYLGAVPLVAATFGERVQAKLIDVGAVFLGALALCLACVVVLVGTANHESIFFALAGSVLVGSIGFFVYTVVTEYQSGQTLGKRMMGLRVVRESGARISLGQSLVRQLPLLTQVFWIDVLFALFTDKSQRAFEIISKTRVVRVPLDEA